MRRGLLRQRAVRTLVPTICPVTSSVSPCDARDEERIAHGEGGGGVEVEAIHGQLEDVGVGLGGVGIIGARGTVDQDPAEVERLSRQIGRGRQADRPGQLPLPAWRDIANRVAKEVRADTVPLLSAGVPFFALFPASVAVVSLYRLVADLAEVARPPGQRGATVADEVAPSPA